MADTQRPIGLAISGAGHRTAVFALGALLYLADSGTNKRIRTIASTSAGSLINAFLALIETSPDGNRRTPLNEISSSDFEQHAAQLARRISGHPLCWWATVFLYAVCLVSWLVVTWIALPNSLSFFWQILFIVVVVVLSILGQCSGGTIWGYWLSWFFAGSIIFGIGLGFLALLAAILVDPSFAIVGGVLILTAVVGFSYRAGVSETAMARTLCASKGKTVRLSEISSGIRHVFCATEFEQGDHAFFCRDVIASRALGRAKPGDLRLGTVVQASANFPVTFPPLRFRKARLGFKDPRAAARRGRNHVLLSDGGIKDGLATAWFLEANKGYGDHHRILEVKGHYDPDESAEEQPRPSPTAGTGAVGETPEQLIVINGSIDSRQSQTGGSLFPVLRELEGLIRLPYFMYRNVERQQLKDLRTRISLPDYHRLAVAGAIASIDESPCWAMSHYIGAANEPCEPVYPERTLVDQRIEAAARRALDMWRHGHDVEIMRSEFNGEIKTIDERVTGLKKELWRLEKELKGLERNSFAYRETDEEILDVKKEIIRLDKDCRNEVLEGRKTRTKTLPPEQRIKEDAEIDKAVEKNSRVRANFRPLGNAQTALLLWHGYLSMMVNGNIFLGLPIIDHGRALADFVTLAKGKVRPRQ